MKSRSPLSGKPLLIALALVILLTTVLVWKHRPVYQSPPLSIRNKVSREIPVDEKPQAHPIPDTVTKLRPLPVSQSTATHEWTKGDGLDAAFVEKIAHNPDEFIKMMEENERIKARQLIYRNDTAAAVIQRAKLSGEAVSSLTLPVLDGGEVRFDVVSADLAPSGQSGTFTGRLAGRPDSMVTLAFKFGREAFTILSPADHLYLQADPREPGEIILKSIDPATYAPGRCGTPDIAAQ